jgi:hypothetical protein
MYSSSKAVSKEHEIGKACRKRGRNKKSVNILVHNSERKRLAYLEDLALDFRIILH